MASQEASTSTKIDSITTNILEEVIVTGQYNPQSIKKSIYNVTVINREQIDNQAANNLADLLNFNLNLTVIPNSQTGQSNISFFGLDSQYFNILIDNIPLVSDTGLGNNIDLTQINLDDIERIEIVEGSMGVEYGANAVSGVINIITKTSIDNKWSIQPSIQEETISDEYAWFDKGRHIQSLNISHNIDKNWYAKIGFNRNQFSGFFNDKQGGNYYENDSLRGYDWLPKTQFNTNATVYYKKNNIKIFNKTDYFTETINFYSQTVRPNINVEDQTSNPSSTDKIYTTDRFINNLNINGRFKTGTSYSFSLSYQQQKRYLNEFNYYIITKQKSDETNELNQSSQAFFSKGTLNNIFSNENLKFQLGYETRFISGFNSEASGAISEIEKTKSQNNYALFSSFEYSINENFLLRPGIRYEHNSKFKSKFLGSLSSRYSFKKGIEIRANIGTSYRTPNFEELYYYFVDSNHNITGNTELKPEVGFSAAINIKKYSYSNNLTFLNSIKFNYIDIKDKIDLAIVTPNPLEYQYVNINAYQLVGLTTENSIKSKNWTFKFGATLQGISRISNDQVNADNDFLYAYQINTNATYFFEKLKTSCTLLLKHNGEQADYIASGTDAEGNSIFILAKTEPYTWLDASIKRSFSENTVQVTLGARNILDVTSINITNSSQGTTHSSDYSSMLLGYGRSYYLKLLFNINY
ncbi:TonB-dependent receptor [Flavicella sp.]|uniref:TonB-dependent receptor plug domain-containing protein n=1 Tax=Flavicella sp. TaxID=2957742 RepID=UPI00301B5DD2